MHVGSWGGSSSMYKSLVCYVPFAISYCWGSFLKKYRKLLDLLNYVGFWSYPYTCNCFLTNAFNGEQPTTALLNWIISNCPFTAYQKTFVYGINLFVCLVSSGNGLSIVCFNSSATRLAQEHRPTRPSTPPVFIRPVLLYGVLHWCLWLISSTLQPVAARVLLSQVLKTLLLTGYRMCLMHLQVLCPVHAFGPEKKRTPLGRVRASNPFSSCIGGGVGEGYSQQLVWDFMLLNGVDLRLCHCQDW